MAWQKNKILLISVENITDENGKTKKVYHRYLINKSKGKGKPNPGKMSIKKYNPLLKKHVVYTETKYK
jgi:ribosomal protein L33